MKKFLAVLCVLATLALGAFGCKEAAQEDQGYYRLFASHIAPNYSEKTDLFGYSYYDFLDRDFVEICTVKDEKTLYGVVDTASRKLLFAPEYADVEMIGDFFLLHPGSDEDDYRVAATDGTVIYESPELPTVYDVGQGYVCVTTSTRSIVYDSKGEEALPSSLMGADYIYTACDNFMIARNSIRGEYMIFNLHTGELKLTLFPPESTVLSVYYAGGNDFIVVYDKETSYDADYDILLAMGSDYSVYLKQTVYRMTVGVETPHIVPVKGYIASLTSRYAFGMTELVRETYPIRDGYFTMGLYNVTDRSADGSIRYVLTDASLNVVAELPDGIRPDTNTVDGYFLSGLQSANVRLFNDRLENVLTLSDGPYHAAVLSDDAIILSKVTDGISLYGAVRTDGTELIEMKYSYLSEFISGKAIGVRDRKSYLVGKDGSETYLSDDPLPYWWDGYYEYRENGRIGLRSYNGTVLTPASYESVDNCTRYGDTVYVAMKIGDAVDVYRLQ